MNRKGLERLIGKHVQLLPKAKHIQSGAISDVKSDWFVDRIADDGVWISLSSGHGFNLKGDHLHQYNSDVRGDRFGTLVLTSQVYIEGNKIRLEPIIGKPGSVSN